MNKKLELFISDLNSSTTEDDIIKNLIKLIREFSVSSYKEVVFSNSYYKSLASDIGKDVIREISFLRESIVIEIIEIDKQIKDNNTEHLDKLKELKRECQSLIYEIDERENDINQLI